MPNTPIENHPLIGTTHAYRADLPAYDASQDTEGGTLILGNGFLVTVRAVFADWNDVPGLDMLYVEVPETGHSTHVTPSDLGLPTVHSYLVTPEVEPEHKTFTVTATLTYDYDSRDGLVSTQQEAEDDMFQALGGSVSPREFTIKVRGDGPVPETAKQILPGQSLDGPNDTFRGTVIASVYLNDTDYPEPVVMVLLLMPTPGQHYRLAEVQETSRTIIGWTDYENIVPAVEAYVENGGDY